MYINVDKIKMSATCGFNLKFSGIIVTMSWVFIFLQVI